MKVLQICYKMPFPLHDGGACSVYASSLGMLSRGMELRILAMNASRAPGNATLIPPGFAAGTQFETVDIDNRIRYMDALRMLAGNESYFISRFNAEAFREKILEILQHENFDIIQLEHLCLCSYISDIRKFSRAGIVLRAQNVEHRVWKEYLQRNKNPFVKIYLGRETAKLEKVERQATTMVDGVMALTETDAAYFRGVATGKPVASIPCGLNLQNMPDQSINGHFRRFPVVYHLGSMDWRPNIQGLKWFVEKVVPLVVKAMPDLRICMAGKNMPSWFFRRSSSNLVVDGRVEDAMNYQEDKAILVVPLLSGSGIRIKILEAFALGKTVISTTTGAMGINAVNGESIFIADDPVEFATHICRCAGSESICRAAGEKARKFAFENYGMELAGARMEAFYRSLISHDHVTY